MTKWTDAKLHFCYGPWQESGNIAGKAFYGFEKTVYFAGLGGYQGVQKVVQLFAGEWFG